MVLKVLIMIEVTQIFFELVAGSKYKNLNNFGTAQKGHILLQNEGSAVAFRIIKIRTF